MSFPPRPPPHGVPPGQMPLHYMQGPPMMGGVVHQMPPGMPNMMYHGPPMPGGMGVPPQGPMPHPVMAQPARPPVVTSSPAVIAKGPKLTQEATPGPTVTVFVGNIAEVAPDNMIRQMLQHCGHVVSWKRVQGASGVLQAFGFCEYSNPDSALRAIRVLHDHEVAGKKLVVKVDAKTKTMLDDYKAAERAKMNGQAATTTGEDDFLTSDQKVQDKWVKERVGQTVKDFEPEMQTNLARSEEKERREQEKEKARALRRDEGSSGDANKLEMDIEDGKKDLITREIGKFREIAKKQDEEKEAEKRRRQEKERERDRDRDRDRDRRDRDRDRDRQSDRDRRRDRGKENSRASRGRSPPSRRSRSPPSVAPAEPSPARRSGSVEKADAESRSYRRTEKDYLREKEEEEEAIERKKAEKKAREKEVAYQERLRQWESRERKKQREHEKQQQKELDRQEEQRKQAEWLKQFLEDYDDERDDPKYYKGKELERRLSERKKEVENDLRDRQKEKEELVALKAKIYSEGHEDPSATFERALHEREQQYKPKVILQEDKRGPQSPQPGSLVKSEDYFSLRDRSPNTTSNSVTPRTTDNRAASGNTSSPSLPPMEEDTMASLPMSTPSPVPVDSDTKSSPGPNIAFAKRKKIDIRDVFNPDEDDSEAPKRRKLVPLDYGDELKKEKEGKSSEDKRKSIKSLIEKIPTDKESLFAFTVEWSLVDADLMERRIKPWVNKKIIEYIGEPEPTLVEFICSKVLAGSAPADILGDVQMVLDEEAEVFVVKLWRLLIYELEAKKLGLMK